MPPVRIPSPVGPLEGLLEIVPSPAAPVGAVICHPHPLRGGTMYNKVTDRMALALRTCGVTTLRFNFRGVGDSSGRYDDGHGEEEDVHAALTFLLGHLQFEHLILAGFSFGAWVSLKVGAIRDDLHAQLAVGVPTELYHFDGETAIRHPVLFIQGEHDEFGSPASVDTLSRRVAPGSDTAVIAGANHLFTGKLRPLVNTIVGRFQGLCPPA